MLTGSRCLVIVFGIWRAGGEKKKTRSAYVRVRTGRGKRRRRLGSGRSRNTVRASASSSRAECGARSSGGSAAHKPTVRRVGEYGGGTRHGGVVVASKGVHTDVAGKGEDV